MCMYFNLNFTSLTNKDDGNDNDDDYNNPSENIPPSFTLECISWPVQWLTAKHTLEESG